MIWTDECHEAFLKMLAQWFEQVKLEEIEEAEQDAEEVAMMVQERRRVLMGVIENSAEADSAPGATGQSSKGAA
jgi:hypothetical protein